MSTNGHKEFIYGRQPVCEALRAARRAVSRVLTAEGIGVTKRIDEIRRLADAARVPVATAPRGRLDALTDAANHQGVAAEVSGYPYVDTGVLLAGTREARQNTVYLVLDHIQDPQNVGSLLRTAEAMGVDGVIMPRDRAAAITPAVVRASAGGTEHIRICRVTNVAQTLRTLKEEGVRCVGLEGLPDAPPIGQVDLSGPVALVVGSEGEGLGRLVRETCDALARIPLSGRVGSLNAGVAGGIALYAACVVARKG
jgi:23S rRNA (guanosine2251-2'-O)-methyltransferase